MLKVMRCPRCNGPFGSEIYEGVEIEKCKSCKGIWLAKNHMASIIQKREQIFSEQEWAEFRAICAKGDALVNTASASIACPVCNEIMSQSKYLYSNNVLIDRCPQGHGVWLDNGELEHIQMAVEENERELKNVAKNKGLRLDTYTTDQIEYAQGKSKLNFWWFLFWPHLR